jgi:acetylornithine/succinyldiaminopimelate/putrescine aminotransferase
VVLERLASGLLTHVQDISAIFHNRLHALCAQYPTVIRDIRGRGLMIGIGMHASAKLAAAMLLTQHQIIVNVTGGEVIRLLPPLVWTETEVDLFLTAFESTVKTISQMISEPVDHFALTTETAP